MPIVNSEIGGDFKDLDRFPDLKGIIVRAVRIRGGKVQLDIRRKDDEEREKDSKESHEPIE